MDGPALTTDPSKPTLDEVAISTYKLYMQDKHYNGSRRNSVEVPGSKSFKWNARRCLHLTRSFEVALAALQRSLSLGNPYKCALDERHKDAGKSVIPYTYGLGQRSKVITKEPIMLKEWGYTPPMGILWPWEIEHHGKRPTSLKTRDDDGTDVEFPGDLVRRPLQTWNAGCLRCPQKMIELLALQVPRSEDLLVINNVLQAFTAALTASIEEPLLPGDDLELATNVSGFRSLRSLAACAVGKAYGIWKEDPDNKTEEDIWYHEIEELGTRGRHLPDMLRGKFCQAVVSAIRAKWFPPVIADIMVAECIVLGHHTEAIHLNRALCDVQKPRLHSQDRSGTAPVPLNNITYLSSAYFTSILVLLEQKPATVVEKWFLDTIKQAVNELDLHISAEKLIIRAAEMWLGIEGAETEIHRRRLLSSKGRTSARTMDNHDYDSKGWITTTREELQHEAGQSILVLAKVFCQDRSAIDDPKDQQQRQLRTLCRRLVEQMLTWSEVCNPTARHEISGVARAAKFLILCSALFDRSDAKDCNSPVIMRELVRILLGATIRHAEQQALEDPDVDDEVDIPWMAKALIGCFRKNLNSTDPEVALFAQGKILDLLKYLMDVGCGERCCAKCEHAQGYKGAEESTFGKKFPMTTPVRRKLSPVYEKRRKYLLAMFVFHASTELVALHPTNATQLWATKVEQRTVELNLPYKETITADDLKTPKFAVLVQEDASDDVIKWRYEEMLDSWVAITPAVGKTKTKTKRNITRPTFAKNKDEAHVSNKATTPSKSQEAGFPYTIVSSPQEPNRSPLYVRHNRPNKSVNTKSPSPPPSHRKKSLHYKDDSESDSESEFDTSYSDFSQAKDSNIKRFTGQILPVNKNGHPIRPILRKYAVSSRATSVEREPDVKNENMLTDSSPEASEAIGNFCVLINTKLMAGYQKYDSAGSEVIDNEKSDNEKLLASSNLRNINGKTASPALGSNARMTSSTKRCRHALLIPSDTSENDLDKDDFINPPTQKKQKQRQRASTLLSARANNARPTTHTRSTSTVRNEKENNPPSRLSHKRAASKPTALKSEDKLDGLLDVDTPPKLKKRRTMTGEVSNTCGVSTR